MTKSLLLITLGGILAIIVGCTSTGSPPTPLEQQFFTVQTNIVPVTVIRTNVVSVTQYETNSVPVTVTNVSGVTEVRTNVVVVPVTVFQTNTALGTNLVAHYEYKPGPGAAEVQAAGGALGNIVGLGGLIGTGLGLIFSIWGKMRSSRNYATAANLAQTIETMRQFVKQLPDGTKYDAAMVSWMQGTQMEAGVADQILHILERDVSNPEARFAAQQLHLALHGLQQSAGVVPPVTPPPPTGANPMIRA